MGGEIAHLAGRLLFRVINLQQLVIILIITLDPRKTTDIWQTTNMWQGLLSAACVPIVSNPISSPTY